MQLYFIRHGQSTNNALWDMTGSSDGRSSDPGLTPLGEEQARLVAEYLATGNPDGGRLPPEGAGGFGITHLYCSLMERAVATGWVIAQVLGLPLEALENIFEEGGIYHEDPESGQRIGQAGQTRAYFEAAYPGIVLPAAFPESGWWNERPYETPEETTARAAAFVAMLREKHADASDRVAIVSHGAFFNYLLAAVTGCPVHHGFWYEMYNTAISRFDFMEDYVLAVYMNRTDHLMGEMLT